MSGEPQAQQRYIPPSRRRDKPILSCNLCRRRKLKCDRQQPCKACVGRGLSLSCTYTPVAHKPSPRPDSGAPSNVYDRIDQLEKLVTTLMEANRTGIPRSVVTATPTSGTKITDEPTHVEIPVAPDQVELNNEETRYANSGHWTSILDGIAELKEQLDHIPTTPPTDPSLEHDGAADLIFGRHRHATHDEILAGLPPREEADQLFANFICRTEVTTVIIHTPTLLRNYEKFWQDPSQMPIMWVGLLYAIFTVSLNFSSLLANGDAAGISAPSKPPMPTARIESYREKVVQCLHLANFPKCPPYTLEVMLLHFMGEYLRYRDVYFGQWLLVGMIIRIAFRMGYHREPSRFSNISPFQAEMRRRLWTIIVQLDLMSSVAVGLPIMIQPSLPDVKEPSNLEEEDLHPDMTELPPPRPDSDSSIMQYCVSRNRLLRVLSKIQDHTNASEQPGYREALELDADLKSTFESIPNALKCHQVRNFDVRSDIAMRRLYIGVTYLKSLMMIHRPFLLLGREDSRYEYSRMMCLDAAIEILDFQTLLEFESRTGFRRWSSNWKLWTTTWRLSYLVNQDFLLATTVLLLDLNKDIKKPMPFPNAETPRIRLEKGQPSRSEVIGALIKANFIWNLASDRSREAAKVTTAINLVLDKVQTSDIPLDTIPTLEDVNESMTQQIPEFSEGINPSLSPQFDFNDPRQPPLLSTSGMSPMDWENFDWAELESQYPLPTFEQNMQSSYFG